MLSMIIIRMPIMIIRREGLLECPDDGRRSVGSHTTTALKAPHRSASIQTLFQFRFFDSSYSSKLSVCVDEKILGGNFPKAVFQGILESELKRWMWEKRQKFGLELEICPKDKAWLSNHTSDVSDACELVSIKLIFCNTFQNLYFSRYDFALDPDKWSMMKMEKMLKNRDVALIPFSLCPEICLWGGGGREGGSPV